MYSTHREQRSAFAERLIRTLTNKIYKYMVSVSNNVYIDKLDAIANEYNNTYHSAIKMKPVNVKSNTYIQILCCGLWRRNCWNVLQKRTAKNKSKIV